MPVQTSPSLDDILHVLHVATDREALHWGPTVDEDTFRADFGLGMVRIERNETASHYVLTLLDNHGILLDEYRPSGEGTLLAFESLHKKARSHALDLTGKVKSLYDHLKDLAGVP